MPERALAQISSSAERRRSSDPQTMHSWAEQSGGGPVLEAGEIIDERFRVDALLGAGGMGSVYAATEIETGQRVALKTMLPKLAVKKKARMRFRREAQAIMRMDHENFVKILDYGEVPPHTPYLVMEYLEGSALRDVMESDDPLTCRRALQIIEGVLSGLAHAHARGVIHRDVKPENVFMVERADGPSLPKLLDLGLAKLVSTDDDAQPYKLTMRGAVFGTPAYMAPEQGSGEEVDARADLYSVTIMLFEMLTGQRPFKARDSPALLVMHKLRPAPTLESRAPFLSVYPALQELVSRGLAKAPKDRFADAEEYRAALERVLVEVEQVPLARSDAFLGPTSSPEAPTIPESAVSDAGAGAGARRRPSTILYVVALLVLVAALALLWAA